jgi:hypothetical protein
MSLKRQKTIRLTDRDIDFLIETASSGVTDKWRLKQIIREDEDFLNRFISEETVFRRVMDDEEILLKISPTLFFEILLRKAVTVLKEKTYTLEKTSTMRIPVFDSHDVVDLLHKESLLVYLADMLSSFTRIESYSVSFRVKKGVWKKIRFNDLDIHSLMNFADIVEEPFRLNFYKRIADICLFILGIFPEHAEYEHRYPFSRQLRPNLRGKTRISPQDYDKEGRKFYKLAAEHPSAEELDLSETFLALHGNFQKAKKPLNFISEHYLQYKKNQVFW